MTEQQYVYITFHDDRLIDRVYATRQSALDRVVEEMHRARGGDELPIEPWDREQLERLAATMISVEPVFL